MGRRKKEIQTIEIPQQIVREKPSQLFCEKCKNSDIRIIKETLNSSIAILFAVADKLDIRGNDYNHTVKEFKRWLKNSNINKSKL